MAKAVVDRFEVVEVQQQHRRGRVATSAQLERDLDSLGDRDTIGQAGQRVVIREAAQLRFGLRGVARLGAVARL
jgi:hypothetical protein